MRALPTGRPIRRLVALAATVAVTLIALAPAEPASAEIDRQSPAVVTESHQALVRYRRYAKYGGPVRLARYERARREAANATAAALGLDAAAMRRAWAAATPAHQAALLAALAQLGVEYRSHTSRPGYGFDCSGLTSYAWRRAGYTIPRSSGDQIDDAARRERATAAAGDLVYYPGHVMMYLGVGRAIVHSSDPQDDVELSFLRAGRSHRWGDPTG
jgi:cell wall-associated NlpC family hydrolase